MPAPDFQSIEQILAAHRPHTIPSQSAERRAAVAMILRDSPAGATETLFIKRAEHPLDPWSGHVAFPGGHQEDEDTSLEDAARRETHEEVGIELLPEMRIGRLDDLHGGRLQQFQMSVSPFVYRVQGDVRLELSCEVADAVWAPLDFLADPANIATYIHPPDPLKRPFPSYRLDKGYVLWGMTYRMVCSFLELFGVNHPAAEPMTKVE